MQCPLCDNLQIQAYYSDNTRDYWQCAGCRLVFVPKAFQLSEAQEKAEYDLHRNHPGDPGYRKFLSRLYLPMLEKQPPPAEGLDFGCGPGPALSHMFVEAGYTMQVYDKFYANNPGVLTRQYDFITCTEVVEHLSAPGKTLHSLFALIRPGGWLGIMTKLVKDIFRSFCYIIVFFYTIFPIYLKSTVLLFTNKLSIFQAKLLLIKSVLATAARSSWHVREQLVHQAVHVRFDITVKQIGSHQPNATINVVTNTTRTDYPIIIIRCCYASYGKSVTFMAIR